jgi:glycosyltransferase involved in cell wall biosynthesis
MSRESRELPLVSIVVPVYNGERYLRQSLDSIVAQTYPRIEVLVMDDTSIDGTPEIIGSYGDRVKYYRQPRNRGQFDNVNDGIGMALGEYIAVYHADDVYEQSIVGREVDFLQRFPEAAAVFCMQQFLDPLGRVYGQLKLPPEVKGIGLLTYPVVLNALLKYKNSFLCGPSSMVRASVYKELGGYRGAEFRIASDLEMWVRIAKTYPIGIIEQHLMSYRSGHENLSQRYGRLRTEPERFFKIMDLYLGDGCQDLAEPGALASYESHRAEDRLMLAINHYILGQRDQSKRLLNQVNVSRLLATKSIQRKRLFILFLAMNVLARVPRITPIANFFYFRWHSKGNHKMWRLIARLFATDGRAYEQALPEIGA